MNYIVTDLFSSYLIPRKITFKEVQSDSDILP